MAAEDGTVCLAVHDCWSMVRSADVGRLAVVIDERPAIFPVNFVVDHGTVVFRTADGSKLAGAAAGRPVAFEVDGYTPDDGTAWSVIIAGHGQQIRQMHELFDASALPLFPWHAAPKQHFVRIVPDAVSGRRFAALRRTATE